MAETWRTRRVIVCQSLRLAAFSILAFVFFFFFLSVSFSLSNRMLVNVESHAHVRGFEWRQRWLTGG